MKTHVDIRVLELLTSRVCHDLVSPVGAVGNGVELLQELGADGIADSLPLIDHSAKQASVRLQIFRLAYGAGGSEAMVSGKQVYEAFKNFIWADTKLSFQWDLMLECPDKPKLGFFKILTNALMLAKDCLPRGGIIAVKMPEGASELKVVATGDMLMFKPEIADALKGDVDVPDLDPKSVGAFIAGTFARNFGINFTALATDTDVTFTIDATEKNAE